MKPVLSSILFGVLVLPGVAFASGPCYTVYAADNSVAYRSEEPPIDLSRPISVGMAERFPGGHLVTAIGTNDCRSVEVAEKLAQAAVPPGGRSASGESPALQLAEEYLGSRLRSRGSSGASGQTGQRGTAAKPAGTEVRVAAYTKDDGTVVPAHTRAAPGHAQR